MEAILLIGIQGSGKSTFYCRRFFHTHMRINLDMLRTRHREDLLLRACVQAKQRFVVDNTNPTAALRAKYIALARAAGFRVIGYYFATAVDDAVRRNRQRPEPHRIPDRGVVATARRLERPTPGEGFDELYRVEVIEDRRAFCVLPWDAPGPP